MFKKCIIVVASLMVLALVFIPPFMIMYLAGFDETFSWARGFALTTVSLFGCSVAGAINEAEKDNNKS